jgi:hypothetical protein
MPQVLGVGNLQYTVVNTAGTTTLNPGQASGIQSQCSVLGGVVAVAVGATWAFTLYDIIPASPGPGGPGITTNTLLNGTATAAGQQFPAGLNGDNVRYRGSLVMVTTGTPGAFNALWD